MHILRCLATIHTYKDALRGGHHSLPQCSFDLSTVYIELPVGLYVQLSGLWTTPLPNLFEVKSPLFLAHRRADPNSQYMTGIGNEYY
jgi:hypothetical protein